MEVHENIEEKVVLIVNIIIMAKGYSYVVARDFGFAPNPFNGFLTLATCKPKIRKWAQVGDFVIGNANKQLNNKLIYMMKVTKKNNIRRLLARGRVFMQTTSYEWLC